MSYYICDSSVDLDDTTHKRIEIKEVLQESTAKEIIETFSFLGTLKSISHLRDIATNNGFKLLDFLDLRNLKSKAFEDNKGSVDLITEANRLTMNYCVSSRIFIDRSIDYIRKKNLGEVDALNIFISLQYDTNFSYRFFYKLRNCIVHDRLPFSYLDMKLPDFVELGCNKNYLLEYQKWGIVRSEIENLPEVIHIENYVMDFSGSLYAIYLKSVYSFRNEILAAHSLINELKHKYEIETPIIINGEIEDQILSNLHPIPYNWLWEATEDLKKHPGVQLKNFT